MTKLPNKFTFKHKMDDGEVYTAEVVGVIISVTWDEMCGFGAARYDVDEVGEYVADGTWFDIVEVEADVG